MRLLNVTNQRVDCRSLLKLIGLSKALYIIEENRSLIGFEDLNGGFR
jgi:hypothetical protein